MKDVGGMICEGCRWWDSGIQPDENGGRCRQGTPRITANGWGEWPRTKRDDWCGRYLTKRVRKAPPREEATS